MTIKTQLKEEAGSLPVKGVTLVWQLRDPKNGNAIIPIPKNTATTPENGEVEIEFMLKGLRDDQFYELFVTASKTTISETDSVSVNILHAVAMFHASTV